MSHFHLNKGLLQEFGEKFFSHFKIISVFRDISLFASEQKLIDLFYVETK